MIAQKSYCLCLGTLDMLSKDVTYVEIDHYNFFSFTMYLLCKDNHVDQLKLDRMYVFCLSHPCRQYCWNCYSFCKNKHTDTYIYNIYIEKASRYIFIHAIINICIYSFFLLDISLSYTLANHGNRITPR